MYEVPTRANVVDEDETCVEAMYANGSSMAGNRNLIQETDVGEIVVYNVKDKDIPIVHRIVRKFGTGYVFKVRELAVYLDATRPRTDTNSLLSL